MTRHESPATTRESGSRPPHYVSSPGPGALLAAAGFEILQYGFSAYLSNFANYNRVYGSLGAVIAALFFVYLNASVFLFGAEVASEYPPPATRAAPQPERTVFRPSVADRPRATPDN